MILQRLLILSIIIAWCQAFSSPSSYQLSQNLVHLTNHRRNPLKKTCESSHPLKRRRNEIVLDATSSDRGGGEEDSEEKSKTPLAFLQTKLDDLWYGVQFVNNRYLETWEKIVNIKTIGTFSLINILFLFGYFRFQTSLLGTFSSSVRWTMENTMLLAGKAANIIYLTLRFPIRALLFPSFFIQSEAITGSKVFAFFSDKSLLDLSKTPLLFQLTCDFHMVPIIEEIIYRYFFYKVWSFLKDKFENNKSLSPDSQSDDETSKLWFGFKPWMIVSSVIFAAAHFTNHLPSKSDAEIQSIIASEDFTTNLAKNYNADEQLFVINSFQYESKYLPVVKAMVQGVTAFIISIYLHCPAFERRGLLGSIATHSTWNLFAAVFLWLQLSIRCVRRRIRNTKEKEEGKSVSSKDL